MCENENMGKSASRNRASIHVCVWTHARMCSLLVEKEAQGVGKSVVLILDSKGYTVVVRDVKHGFVGHVGWLVVGPELRCFDGGMSPQKFRSTRFFLNGCGTL